MAYKGGITGTPGPPLATPLRQPATMSSALRDLFVPHKVPIWLATCIALSSSFLLRAWDRQRVALTRIVVDIFLSIFFSILFSLATDGIGTMDYTNGHVYHGQWYMGDMHGQVITEFIFIKLVHLLLVGLGFESCSLWSWSVVFLWF